MKNNNNLTWGGIEAGGTKFVCAVGSGPQDIREIIRIPTTSPSETISHAIDFFLAHHQHEPLSGLGVASFGPVELNPTSATFGYITSTPKPGWANTDLLGPLRQALGVNIAFDTDVNGAALGEHRWGAAKGLENFLYITVGTGIGGGGMINGKLLHGLLHPEIGHMRIPHDLVRDPFGGHCAYHQDCLEGLASGPAMAARWGQPAEDLPPEHEAWELEAQYLGHMVTNLILTLSPQRIVIGGGLMAHPGLLEKVQVETQYLLNGYLQVGEILNEIDKYLVPPKLGDQAGVLGALALAQQQET